MDIDSEDIDSEKDKIDSQVAKGNYHAAINLAISVVNECRRNNHQRSVDDFFAVIEAIVRIMCDKFGSQA